MLSFGQFITERYFNRKDMPQIRTADLETAISILKKEGIKVNKGQALASTFKPSQKDIYGDKVKTIMDRTNESDLSGMKPFVISSDNFIVDGHHRWKAMLQKFPKAKFSYIQIGLPIKQAVDVYIETANKIK